MVTSRQRLDLREERCLDLPPLDEDDALALFDAADDALRDIDDPLAVAAIAVHRGHLDPASAGALLPSPRSGESTEIRFAERLLARAVDLYS